MTEIPEWNWLYYFSEPTSPPRLREIFMPILAFSARSKGAHICQEDKGQESNKKTNQHLGKKN